MENRKIIVGVVALAALLLLFAGVGYAVFNGNARTYNEGNTDALEYMTATPADFDPIAADAESLFDTYVYGHTYTKVADAEKSSEHFGDYYLFITNKYVKADDGVRTYDANADYFTKNAGVATAYVLNDAGVDDSFAVYLPVASPDSGDFDKYYLIDGNNYVKADDGVRTYDANADYFTKAVYTALGLGDKVIAVDNQTGSDISALNLAIKAAPGPIGSTDFVYVFEVVGTAAAKYAVFDGDSELSIADLACEIDSAASANVTVTLYIAYVPNVYVPNTYIGAASAVEQTGYVPYICPSAAPESLGETAFGFTFTDATPASP